jgi:hypothetical protein
MNSAKHEIFVAQSLTPQLGIVEASASHYGGPKPFVPFFSLPCPTPQRSWRWLEQFLLCFQRWRQRGGQRHKLRRRLHHVSLCDGALIFALLLFSPFEVVSVKNWSGRQEGKGVLGDKTPRRNFSKKYHR